MEIIAKRIFEPLREWVGGAIKINSFFRNEETNRAIGGASKSMHIEGRAIDIDDVYGHKTNAEMYHYIKDNLDFDTLIWEFGTDDNPSWVHVSYIDEDFNPSWVHVSYIDEDFNRQRCLKAIRENGKTKYITI
jgi:hypothetical protein